MATKAQRAVIILALWGAICSTGTQATKTFPACNGDKSVFDDGLCYPGCPLGLSGIGPLCFSDCPSEFTDIGLLCSKPSESQPALDGNPLTPTCASGEELNGLLCYPKCSSNFYGVGPICWQKCPNGLRDDGAFCAKVSKGRGVGTIPPMRCNSNEELKGALCYPKCRTKFYGVGPVCWAYCDPGYTDHGATCFKNIFDFYWKSSYGRGFGRVPAYTCSPYQDNDAGLCYPRCDPGFDGVGPVCWSRCPSDMTDIGVSCSKKRYGRTAGTIPKYVCAGPNEATTDEWCYPKCKEGYSGSLGACSKRCPDGYTDLGPTCAKLSEGRGVGIVPPTCTSNSFTKAITNSTLSASSEPFAMIFTSDLRYLHDGLSSCGDDTKCQEETRESYAIKQVKAINRVHQVRHLGANSTTMLKPTSVVFNGDLTSSFEPGEYEYFNNFYTQASNYPGEEVLEYPVMPGLGDHDYEKNVDFCLFGPEPYYGLKGINGCSEKAADFIRGAISCNTIPNFPASKIESYDEDSLAYSWNEGRYHFVQLHNYPFYVIPHLGIKASIEWFKKDIAAAKQRGQPIILNVHRPAEVTLTQWDVDTNNPLGNNIPNHLDRENEWKAILRESNVIAIFAGNGEGFAPNEIANIPIFHGGQAGIFVYGMFTHVEFYESSIKVSTLQSNPSVSFYQETNAEYQRTVSFDF